MNEIYIPAKNVKSLSWEGDTLVDWVGGGTRCQLNGKVIPANVRYAFPFDASATLTGSSYSVIYTRCGTKGLLLKDGAIHREFNRSYYHANVYEYPIVLFRLPSGREVMAHCPLDYCRLDIEDLATGEILTNAVSRKPGDIFHSRLSVSPDGQFLVSSGWLWHPIDEVNAYDVVAALNDPTNLDGVGLNLKAYAEESSSTFLPNGRLVIALRGDIDSDEGPTMQGEFRIVDLRNDIETTVVSPVGQLGTIFAIGNDHILALYDHPRLINLVTGKEVYSWPQFKSGTQTSSILMSGLNIPVIAVDSINQRFAIADENGITVIKLQA